MSDRPEWPGIGAACNGCGLCCRTVICAAGAMTLGLAQAYGDRAPGPCPALVTSADGAQRCGMILRPKDYAPGKGGAHDLREAFGVLTGAGIGCDEAGDLPDDVAGPELRRIQTRYLETVGPARIEAAVRRWFGV